MQKTDGYFSIDALMMGGLSLLACTASWMFIDRTASILTASQFAFVLAFAINHPHFMSSYMLMYGDFRQNILKKPRYFLSAIIVPLILAPLLVMSLLLKDVQMMGHIINGMYFFVGWHYVKQVFGCVIVSSAQRKIFYQKWERNLILLNLYPVWMMSWLQSHVGNASFEFYGIPHYGLGLPRTVLTATYAAVAITFVGVVFMQFKKYIREGVKPSPPAVAAFGAIYAWYLPVSVHPQFAYFIPAFHSLQYLAFVWMLKRNQVDDEIKDLKDREWRSAWVTKFIGYGATAVALGMLSFEIVPKNLDNAGLIPSGTIGYAPILASFLLFINIHHYFIDNAIWRSDNEVVRKFLFQSRPKLVETKSIKGVA